MTFNAEGNFDHLSQLFTPPLNRLMTLNEPLNFQEAQPSHHEMSTALSGSPGWYCGSPVCSTHQRCPMDEAVRLCPHSKRGHKPYVRKCTDGLPKKCSEKNPAERGEGVPGAGGCCLSWVAREASPAPRHLGRAGAGVINNLPCRILGPTTNLHRETTSQARGLAASPSSARATSSAACR